MKFEDWVIIGISGVTCGGKTTLANRLKDALTPVYVFNQDKYFYPDDSPHHIKCEGLDHNNYDILSSLDMGQMYDDVLKTLKGENKALVVNRLRKGGMYEILGKKFMVIEGFTVLNYKPLNDICHFRYYFTLDYETCLSRRVYRLYDPPDVDGYFDLCVWPEHLKYRTELESDPRIRFMDGNESNSLGIVLDDLKHLGIKQIEDR